MDRCDKYQIYDKWMIEYGRDGVARQRPIKVGICLGTKEKDECLCRGNCKKCDFYPDIREKATKRKNEDLGSKIDGVVAKINKLDLSGYIQDEETRNDIVSELINIKTIIEKRNT